MTHGASARDEGELRHEAEFRTEMRKIHPEPVPPVSDADEIREWLEVVLDATDLGTWSFQVSLRVFQLSDACRTLLAAPELEGFIPAEAVLDRVHSGDRERAEDLIRTALEDRGACDVRFRVMLPDGGERWLHVTARGLCDAAGRIAQFIGTARDVSRDFAAAEELRASQERYYLIAKSAREVPWEWDVSGGRVEWGEAAGSVFGYEPGQIVSTLAWWEARIHPEDRDRVLAGREEHLAGTEWLWSDEYRFERGNGSYVSVLDRGSVARDGRGAPIRMLGSMVDLSGSGSAENRPAGRRGGELRAIKDYEGLLERLQRLAESFGSARELGTIFAGLRDFALASVPSNGVFISLYDSEERLRRAVYAWSEGEEVDLSTLPPLPLNDSPHSRAIATGRFVITDDLLAATAGLPYVDMGLERDPRAPQSSLVVPMITKQQVKGGLEVQWVEPSAYTEAHVTAVQMAANLAATAIENVQLLERERHREEELRQAQRMEAVGRLAGGVAHDFNNLLTVINGYSEMIAMQLDEADPLLAEISEIRAAGGRAAGLTRQLLAFSRRQVLQPRPIDLGETASGLSRMLRRLIGEDVELAIAPAEGLWPVTADSGQIEQVIINLVVNARDAIEGCGRIKIETVNAVVRQGDAVSGRGVAPGAYVRVSVADTGSGMDAETMTHIFEPFFTTKEVGKGTGLGLATVYGIVKQSGGSIEVDSTPGIGTRFAIYLPRSEESARESAGESTGEVRGKGETILVVEDDDAVRRFAVASLRRLGYRVLEAESAAEALVASEVHDGPVQLLLTDVVMPGMSGRELAERLVRRRPETKVLYMSGYTEDAVMKRGVVERDIALLQKPFMPASLGKTVREVLDGG